MQIPYVCTHRVCKCKVRRVTNVPPARVSQTCRQGDCHNLIHRRQFNAGEDTSRTGCQPSKPSFIYLFTFKSAPYFLRLWQPFPFQVCLRSLRPILMFSLRSLAWNPCSLIPFSCCWHVLSRPSREAWRPVSLVRQKQIQGVEGVAKTCLLSTLSEKALAKSGERIANYSEHKGELLPNWSRKVPQNFNRKTNEILKIEHTQPRS